MYRSKADNDKLESYREQSLRHNLIAAHIFSKMAKQSPSSARQQPQSTRQAGYHFEPYQLLILLASHQASATLTTY